MSLVFSTVNGFIFPGVVSEEVLLLEAIYSLPPELVRCIMQFNPTCFDLFRQMVYPYKTKEPFVVEYPHLMGIFCDSLYPVMKDELDHHVFDYASMYSYLAGKNRIISFYQHAMAAVWYIYHHIDPYHKNSSVKKVVIQHLTAILHEVLATGNRETVFDLDEGLGMRLHMVFVWSHLQHYVSSLIDGFMDEEHSYPLCDILDSLCFQTAFYGTRDALECLQHFYHTAPP
jgi:hypothetical protein